MFAVVVTFQIRVGDMETFLPAMTQNARTSLAKEPGCLRFDVCTDEDRPNEVFLYEVYKSRTAFERHLASAHFKAFDAAAGPMITSKKVHTYRQVAS